MKRYRGLGCWQDTRTSGTADMLLVCACPSATALLHASIAASCVPFITDAMTSVKMDGRK